MKKRRKGSSLSRTKDQKDALLKTMLVSLIRYQKIRTTLAKAKELKPFAERMLTHAKVAVLTPEKKVAQVRLLSAKLPKVAVGKLLKIGELFKERSGGYTRIVKLPARKSDASKMALIEWVEQLPAEKAQKKGMDKKKKEPKKAAAKEETQPQPVEEKK